MIEVFLWGLCFLAAGLLLGSEMRRLLLDEDEGGGGEPAGGEDIEKPICLYGPGNPRLEFREKLDAADERQDILNSPALILCRYLSNCVSLHYLVLMPLIHIMLSQVFLRIRH